MALSNAEKLRRQGLVVFERDTDGAPIVHIPLTQDKFVTIDECDLPLVMLFAPWCAHKNRCNWYALTSVPFNGKLVTLRMHRLIANPPDDVEVDHFDGNGLNNRCHNLRRATQAQNQHNRRMQVNNTSGFKGVVWRKDCKKWHAQIRINYKNLHLGYFVDPGDAALAYDDAARKHFGQFAAVNFPLTNERAI